MSKRIMQKVQPNKFSPWNMDYYARYLETVQSMDIEDLFFLDECHFDSRAMQKGSVWLPKGHNAQIEDSHGLKQRFNLILIANIKRGAPSSIYITINKEANDSRRYSEFVASALQFGFFHRGCTLIMDNASIHKAPPARGESFRPVIHFDPLLTWLVYCSSCFLCCISLIARPSAALARPSAASPVPLFSRPPACLFVCPPKEVYMNMEDAGIQVKFLPVYSPELNPVEKIFSYIKGVVRRSAGKRYDMKTLVEIAVEKMPYHVLRHCFEHCVNRGLPLEEQDIIRSRSVN